MSNIASTIKMSNEFHKLAQETLANAFENAARMVHLRVIFHRPDSPSLVQEFTWGTEDLLIPAMRLIDRINMSKKGFDGAKGAFSLETAITELEDLIGDVKADIEAARKLPAEFDLSFKHTPFREHVLMIKSVPFAKAQNFLRHWHDTLEDRKTGAGLLNTVTITHTPLPQIGSDALRRRIVTPASRHLH